MKVMSVIVISDIVVIKYSVDTAHDAGDKFDTFEMYMK